MNHSKLKLVVSTGAGISAESGLATFRGSNGLWGEYRVEDVASADGFRRDPALVHKFYNIRRRELAGVEPNKAHRELVELERYFDVTVITQNVDDLHERAGSSSVLHLHGELMKIRSLSNPDYVETLSSAEADTSPATRGANGDLMRPHIVFFQEAVPNMEPAIEIAHEADIFVVIGTSMVVYPAAALIQYVRRGIPIYYIDPHPADVSGFPGVTVIAEKAGKGVEIMIQDLKKRGYINEK